MWTCLLLRPKAILAGDDVPAGLTDDLKVISLALGAKRPDDFLLLELLSDDEDGIDHVIANEASFNG